MRDLSDRQALALHLVHVLVCKPSLPSGRDAHLYTALLAEHAPTLCGDEFGMVRGTISELLAARSHVEWTFARGMAERALARLHLGWSAQLIGALSVKRMP